MPENDVFTTRPTCDRQGLEHGDNTEIHERSQSSFDTTANESHASVSPSSTNKLKFEFNITSIILCCVVIALIAIIVWLVARKPKLNNELLTKTQEMYQETKRKNKELTDSLAEVEKKNKLLENTNENIMKTNSDLKGQVKGIETELNNYKARESQELELKQSAKPKTYQEHKKALYDSINPPAEPTVEPPHEEQETEMKLDASDIAARQQNIQSEMIKQMETKPSEIENVMSVIN